MLLKCSNLEAGKGKGKLTRAATVMRMTMSTGSTMTSRVHRKIVRIPSKRHPGKAIPGKLHSMNRVIAGKVPPGKRLRPTQTHCDNSNDSGLGFDQYADVPYTNARQVPTRSISEICPSTSGMTAVRLGSRETFVQPSTSTERMPLPSTLTSSSSSLSSSSSVSMATPKRQRIQSKLDVDDTCSNDGFIFSQQQRQPKVNHSPSKLTCNTTTESKSLLLKINSVPRTMPRTTIRRTAINTAANNNANNNGVLGAVTLQSQIGSCSQSGKSQLQILAQPEQQHRARYQTEGSRGAVKDRSGNGFPIVKLIGYNTPTTLQIFIGTDLGRVAPHMFYQACKVSGKNSTPCTEKKIEGTILIEIDLKPDSDMTATCDCVGILKERNVDVEHRFPEHSAGPRSKKKSTRCRMVFRTQVTHDDGQIETLQVCSQQIICTQPPGVPEICKKSLVSCPANGGLELFVIGKNFLKDTRVIFQARRSTPTRDDAYDILWEESVQPDKEFLQQTHLVCVVPSYVNPEIIEPVTVQLLINSSNKFSEPHSFIYTPKGSHGSYGALAMATTMGTMKAHSGKNQSQDGCFVTDDSSSSSSSSPTINPSSSALMLWGHPISHPKNELDSGMMPPPSITLPMSARRPSLSGVLACSANDHLSPPLLKAELMDESSQNSIISAETLNHDAMDHFSVSSDNSMDSNSGQQAPHQLQTTMVMMDHSPLELIMQKSANTVHGFNGNIAQEAQLNGMLNLNATGMDLRVKHEEQIAAQIEQLVNTTSVEGSNELFSVVAQQSEQKINNFLSNLDARINDLKAQVEAGPLYNTTTAADTTAANVIFNNAMETIAPQSNLVTTASNTLHHHHHQTIDNQTAFTTHQALMTEAGTATTINHILSYPAATTASALMEPGTNQAQLATDVILNSQPAVVLNTSGDMLSVNSGNAASLSANINNPTEPDIIMNPAISPSMMCQSTTGDSGLMNGQVTLGDNALLSVSVGSTAQQTGPNSMLNNLLQPIMPSVTMPQQNTESNSMHHIPIKQTPAAVKNMILNAAADILSSEPNSITTETTINALMSLTPVLSDVVHTDPQQHPQVTSPNIGLMNVNNATTLTQQVSPHNPTMMMSQHNPFESQTTQTMNDLFTQTNATTAAAVLNNQLIQNVVAAAVQSDIIQNQITVSDPLMNNYSMANHHHMNSQLMTMQTTSPTNTLCPQQSSFLNDFQQADQQQSQQRAQDNVLQAVSLMAKQAQTNQQIANVVATVSNTTTSGIQTQQPQQPTTNANAIPQDITTMSDNDLISYINPSCFDQV